jgi:hypothetical protein
MVHRLYKLDHGVSLLGLKPQDMIVLYGAFMIGFQLLGGLFPGRFRIVFAVLFVFMVFKLWQALRDRLPEKFFLHLALWLSEPEVYRPTPERQALPLVVDPVRIAAARRVEAPVRAPVKVPARR